MAIGTRRHKLLTGDDVGSLVRWTVATQVAREALLLTADDVGALAKQTDDTSYHILANYLTPVWVQLGNVTTATSDVVPPTVDDDELAGHAIGDMWVDTNLSNAHICMDATAGAASWLNLTAAGGGSGDVVGPASATANAIALFNGTTGKLLKDSAALLSAYGATLIDDADASTARATLGVDAAGTDNSTDQTDATLPLSGVIGSPTITTAQDAHNDLQSAGAVSGGGVTDDGDGTITVAAGTGFIRATDSPTADLLAFDWSSEAGAGVALTTDSMNYIYVEYNGGTPQVVATTSKRTDHNTSVELATVYRYTGTDIHITPNEFLVSDLAGHLNRRLEDVDGLTHETGHAVSDPGTKHLAVTAGAWWVGMVRNATAAIDTSASDTFNYYYSDGAGGFTDVASSTIIDNLQYDDGSGSLATLANNRYGTHFVYMAQDGAVYVVYGTGSYTLGQASEAPAPSSVPPHFNENHAGLIARVIIAKSASAFTAIDSAFERLFNASGVADHGGLAGLGDDDHSQYSLADGTRGGNVVGPASAYNNYVPVWDGTTGKLLKNIGNLAIDAFGGQQLGGTGVSIRMPERATAPSNTAGTGYYWVKNDAPTTPWFTDDASGDFQIGRSYITKYFGQAFGGATVGTWYGPHTSSIYATGTAAFSRGTGADPTVYYYSVNEPLVADATVRGIEMWYRASPSTTDGDLRMYKSAFVDGTGGTTLTQIGSDFVVSGTNTNRYDISQAGIDASVSKGDTLELFWRHRTTGTVWVSCSVLLELD